MKLFGRQLFFKFHHFIYEFAVDDKTPNCNLKYEKVVDNLERIDIGYFSLRMLKNVLRKNSNTSECFAFIDSEGLTVGFVLICYKGAKDIHYRVKDADAFITALGVFPEYRGKGYSQEILKGIVDICRLKGLRKLKLSVDSNNYAAINAYEKFGFIKIGDKKFFRITAIDFLIKKRV